MRDLERIIGMHPDLSEVEIKELRNYQMTIESGRDFLAISKLNQFMERARLSEGAYTIACFLIWSSLLSLGRVLEESRLSIQELQAMEKNSDDYRKRINAFRIEEGKEIEIEKAVELLISIVKKYCLKERAKSREQDIIKMIYYVLTGIGTESVADFMIKQIEQKERYYIYAVEKLGSISGEKGIECLINVLDTHETFGDRKEAAISLGKINHPRVVDKLIHVVEDPSTPTQTNEDYNKWVRYGALEGLGHNDSEKALEYLIEIMKSDKPGDIRKEAMQGIRWKKDEKKIKKLISVFDNLDESVKVEIAFALGSMGKFEEGISKEDRYSILEELLDTVRKPELLKTLFLAVAYSKDGRLFPLLKDVAKREYVTSALYIVFMFKDNLDIAMRSLEKEYENL